MINLSVSTNIHGTGVVVLRFVATKSRVLPLGDGYACHSPDSNLGNSKLFDSWSSAEKRDKRWPLWTTSLPSKAAAIPAKRLAVGRDVVDRTPPVVASSRIIFSSSGEFASNPVRLER
jgi:hypothetical protein